MAGLGLWYKNAAASADIFIQIKKSLNVYYVQTQSGVPDRI